MTHLTEPELYDLLESTPGSSVQPAAAAHAATCARCRTELTSLRASVSLLRESTSAYAAAHTPAVLAKQAPQQPQSFFSIRPALAGWVSAAVLVVAGAVGLANLHHPAAPANVPTAAAVDPATSDEAFLQSVSDDIDQPVPTSLRILAGPSTQSQRTNQAQPEHSERNN